MATHKILVVDDSPTERFFLADLLAELNAAYAAIHVEQEKDHCSRDERDRNKPDHSRCDLVRVIRRYVLGSEYGDEVHHLLLLDSLEQIVFKFSGGHPAGRQAIVLEWPRLAL